MSAGDDILILLAAGSARRMQSVVDDKITALLAGKPVFVHSLQSFLTTGLIGRVVITYRDEAQLAKLRTLVAAHLPSAAAVEFVPGGESRQDSVLVALNTCEGHAGLVHIHDGARPLVSAEAIRKVRAKAHETGAAILAGRAADTVKIAKADSASVETSPDRGLVWTAETPQVFRTAIVLKAYRKVAELQRKVTDDSSAVEFVGQDVSLVENPSVNLKLTRPADFVLAEAILKTRRGSVAGLTESGVQLDLEVRDVLRRRAITRGARGHARTALMVDIPIGLFAVRESDVSADHRMRLGDRVDLDGDDSSALGGSGGRRGLLGGSGFGGGFFRLLGLFLLDEGKVEVVDEETDVHVGHRDFKLGGQALLDLRERRTFGHPGGDLGDLFGSQFGHRRPKCGNLRRFSSVPSLNRLKTSPLPPT